MKKFNLFFALITISFSAFSQAPTITSFSPASGPVGTLVTITGTNLSSPTAFTIGGVAAILVSGSSDSIVGMVMPGAVTGSVSVTTAGGTDTGGSNFYIMTTGYPSMQQGTKLVGTGAVGNAWQGYATALSADGNTAIVGAPYDNNQKGAAWIYTRSGSIWTQQDNKLVGTSTTGGRQGYAVAISADGNTAIVGGYADNGFKGAAWIFTRAGGTWTQQGNKLVGTGGTAMSEQGSSVAISADGNTAIVGAYGDDTAIGAAWIYTRTGTTWTQQGSKLVGTGAVGASWQGQAVALSADGNTAIVGGFEDDNFIGAAWVFTRSGTTWTQQGNKLIGTGAVNTPNNAWQGYSVALSADGNTAIVGGPEDDGNIGAIWVYTRSYGTWAQQGSKLVGNGAPSPNGDEQGTSVALSADGNTAIVGGPGYNASQGATWVYTRIYGSWSQQTGRLVGTGSVGPNVDQGSGAGLSADGNTAIIGGYQDNSEAGAAWVFTASCIPTSSSISQTICQGDTFILGSRQLTTSGIYTDTFTNIGGCDSIIILDLRVVSVLNTSISHSICAGSSYIFGGHTLTTTGTYSDTLTSIGGCDSVVTLTLTVNNVFNTNLSRSICAGSTYSFGGHTLSSAGTYSDTLTSSAGCDSIISLTLTVNNVLNTSLSQSICAGSSYSFGGHTLSAAGTYSDTLTSSAGCDSIITLTLTVNQPSSSAISHTICQGDSFVFNNIVYYTAGTYTDTLTNLSGCDSLVTLTLTVNPLPVVSLTWDSLVQHGDLTIYFNDTLWVRLLNDPKIFPATGGYPTGGTYTGNYVRSDTFDFTSFTSSIGAVMDTIYYTYIDSNGCSAVTSNVLYLSDVVGIREINAAQNIHLYPNPNKGSFSLQTSNSVGSDYTISDMLGHIILQQSIRSDNEPIELPDAANGVYTLAVKGMQPIRFVIVR